MKISATESLPTLVREAQRGRWLLVGGFNHSQEDEKSVPDLLVLKVALVGVDEEF